jgi:hypothetical protein
MQKTRQPWEGLGQDSEHERQRESSVGNELVFEDYKA